MDKIQFLEDTANALRINLEPAEGVLFADDGICVRRRLCPNRWQEVQNRIVDPIKKLIPEWVSAVDVQKEVIVVARGRNYPGHKHLCCKWMVRFSKKETKNAINRRCDL